MRASLGFRAGPLYVGTGNLLKTKSRTRGPSGGEIVAYLVIAPFVLLYFLGVALWWLLAVSWRNSTRTGVRPVAAVEDAQAEAADDPAWTPPRRMGH